MLVLPLQLSPSPKLGHTRTDERICRSGYKYVHRLINQFSCPPQKLVLQMRAAGSSEFEIKQEVNREKRKEVRVYKISPRRLNTVTAMLAKK